VITVHYSLVQHYCFVKRSVASKQQSSKHCSAECSICKYVHASSCSSTALAYTHTYTHIHDSYSPNALTRYSNLRARAHQLTHYQCAFTAITAAKKKKEKQWLARHLGHYIRVYTCKFSRPLAPPQPLHSLLNDARSPHDPQHVCDLCIVVALQQCTPYFSTHASF
jgi:hypothetical protein